MKKTLWILGVLALIVIGFLWYIGVFATIKVEEKTEGGYTVAGVEVVGPYSKAGQHIGEVANKLKEVGVLSTKGFGIYYDDPKNTPQEKCRSLVGFIIEQRDIDKIKSTGLKVDSVPSAKAVVAEFPLRNMLSYMIGPVKVYPEISGYMSEKKYKPVLSFEIYDSDEKKIIFAMQYSPQ